MAITVICTYTLKDASRQDFIELLSRHWSTLNRHGLVSGEPSRLMAGHDDDAQNQIVEIFDWKSRDASAAAHQLPDVLAIWEPMGQLCESMDFRHFTALA